MSKVDDLIAKLCPNGVEYKTLGEVAVIGTGSRNTNEAIPEGKYPFFVRSQQPLLIDEFEFDEISIITAGDGVGVGKVFHFVNGKYALHQRAYRIHITSNHLNPKFIFYFIRNDFARYLATTSVHASVTSLRKPMFEKYPIPVPPLEIQREIVKVLDTFTKLEAELEAELKLRRKQYQYYIDDLLNFENDIPNLKLSEIFEFKNGLNKGKEFFGKGNFIVKYTDVYKNNFLFKSSLSDRVEVTENEKNNVSAKKGDVFFTRTSETREEIGFASVLLEDIEGCVFSGFLIRGRQKQERLLPKYCSYCFKSKKVREQIIKNCIFTTRASLSGANLGLVKIPVPSLEEQARIVAILDKFDALVNDLSSGLPAEIAARRKQYEHYRDRLLTFKEAQ